MSLQWSRDTSSVAEVATHLHECNQGFVPPLASRVDLHDYANKLVSRSIRFEVWKSCRLVGLLAMYSGLAGNGVAFITNVSVTPDYQGKGLASELMDAAMKRAIELGCQYIQLDVARDATPAIRLYLKYRFRVTEECDGQIRMHRNLKGQ